MKVRVVVFMFVILFSSISMSFAQDTSPKSLTDAFLRMLQDGKTSQAFDLLFVGSEIPKSKPQAVEVLKRQIDSALPLYGKILGFESIREEKFGTTIVRLVYVLKSEKAPTIWEFYYYKPKSEWFLANVMFNDQFFLLESKQ